MSKREARNIEMREKYGELYDWFLDLFVRHDPVGLFGSSGIGGPPKDEYSIEVISILPILKENNINSQEQILDVIYKEFGYWFGEDCIAPKNSEKFQDAAKEIYEKLKND